MKKTTLHEVHSKELKAKMAPFAGFSMPILYTSAKNEINAVRKTAGVFDVSHMGEFFIHGKETAQFINYIITNDYEAAPVNKAVYSPICNDEGKIIDDLIVYKISQNSSLVCVNAANIDKDWEWFSSRAKHFDVSIQNKSNEYSLLALQGPKSESILLEMYPEFAENIKNTPYYGLFSPTNSSLIFARTGYTGEDGFEIFSLNKDVGDIWSKLVKNGATPCGLAARDTLRLEVCYPLYGKELDEGHTPKESSLGWALKKGDVNYIGKSSIENKVIESKIIKLSLQNLIPRESYRVFIGEQDIGHITSGTFSPTISQGIALARVKNIKNIKEEDLLIEIRGKKYPATYHSKPFYSGEKKK